MAPVPGMLAALTLDGNIITLVVNRPRLTRSKTSLDKSVMDGSGESVSIPGMKSGTIAIDGFIDQANLNLLEVSYAKDVPVAFVLELTEGLTTDASWSGNVTLGDYDIEAGPDDLWKFTLGGDTSGTVTFTPSTP